MVNLTKTGLFMFGLFVLGIGLMICFINIQSSIPSSCSSLKLKNYLNGILVLSIISLTLPISYMLCNLNCNKDSVAEKDNKIINIIYVFIIFGLGSTVITLGTFIKNELSIMNCDENNKFSVGIMIGLGALYLFIGFVILLLQYRKK